MKNRLDGKIMIHGGDFPVGITAYENNVYLDINDSEEILELNWTETVVLIQMLTEFGLELVPQFALELEG